MSLAVLSLLGLLIVVALSCCIPKINPGLLAITVALGLGLYDETLSTKSILASFPSELFLLLVSMCIVFGIAHHNNTLPILTSKLIAKIGGKIIFLPLIFFVLTFVLSALGPGNIAAVALVAPLAMTIAHQYKLSPLLTAIMICTGANAGAFSPFAPTGVISVGLMQKIGLDASKLSWTVFAAAALLQSLTAALAYAVFLVRFRLRAHTKSSMIPLATKMQGETLNKAHWLTILGIVALILAVVVGKAPLLITALCVVFFFTLLNVGEPEEVMASIPWSTLLMITGMSILIGIMEKTGGLELATSLLASVTAPHFVNATLAFVTGLVSAFSSSSGVVLPAFIPLLPGLAQKMQQTDMVNMVIAVAAGSHMVDVSPLSTLGALSLAALVDQKQRQRVFNLLMAWGMSMAVVGSGIAYIFLDVWK